MGYISQITKADHPQCGYWVYIVRIDNTTVFGSILDGQTRADPEGVPLDAAILGGGRYIPSTYLLDLPNGGFKRFPVTVHGVRTETNPEGTYSIASLTSSAIPDLAPPSVLKPGKTPGWGHAKTSGVKVPKPYSPVVPVSAGYGESGGVATLEKVAITPPPVVVPPAPKPRPKKLVTPSASGLATSSPDDHSPPITVDEMIEYLEATPVNQTLMFWGSPGIGKSAGIDQFAAQKGAKLHTFLMSTVDPTILQGIGVPDHNSGKMKWFPDENIPTEPNSILFLDEITSAPTMIQALAYRIVWDRAIGNKPLPPDCRVIMAGNRTTDRGVAFPMPSPLANRCAHLTVVPDIGSWRKWAYTTGIDARLIAFLTLRSSKNDSLLHKMDPKRSSGPWPSPRSWANANRYLTSTLTPQRMGVAMAGCVGIEETKEFIKFCAEFEKYSRTVFEILDGKNKNKVIDPSQAITIACAVVANATTDPQVIRNALDWAKRQDAEFAAVVERGLDDRFGDDLITEATMFGEGKPKVNHVNEDLVSFK